MFAYNPGVNDRSGELIAQGANNAAQINAQMLSDFGQNIGSVLANFGEAYKQKEQDKSDARIYGNLLKVIAPSFGQNGDAVLQEYNSLKSDRDKANFGRTMVGSLGVIGNMYAQTGRLGLQQQGQQIQQNAPFNRAAATNAQTVASGGGTVPLDDPANYTPSAAPGTGAIQAASAWYGQSSVPTSMSGGAMKPFWKQ